MKSFIIFCILFLLGGRTALGEKEPAEEKVKTTNAFQRLREVLSNNGIHNFFNNDGFNLFKRQKQENLRDEQFKQILVDFSNDLSFEDKLKVFSVLREDETLSEEEAMQKIREKIRSGNISPDEKTNIINIINKDQEETLAKKEGNEKEDFPEVIKEQTDILPIVIPLPGFAKNIIKNVRNAFGSIFFGKAPHNEFVEEQTKEMYTRHFNSAADMLLNDYYKKFRSEAILIEGYMPYDLFMNFIDGKAMEERSTTLDFKHKYSDYLDKMTNSRQSDYLYGYDADEAEYDEDEGEDNMEGKQFRSYILEEELFIALIGYSDIERSEDVSYDKLDEDTYDLTIGFTVGPVNVVPKYKLNQKPMINFRQNGTLQLTLIRDGISSELEPTINSATLKKIDSEAINFDSSIDDDVKDKLTKSIQTILDSLDLEELIANIMQEVATDRTLPGIFNV